MELTFENKFEIAMQKLDEIEKNIYSPKRYKKYIDEIKFENLISNREDIKIPQSPLIYSEKKENKIDWLDIKKHEKKCDQNNLVKKAKKEIYSYLSKEKDKENIMAMKKELYINKLQLSNYDKIKLHKSSSIQNKDIKLYELNKKKRDFSNVVNQSNILKIKKNRDKKKLSPIQEIQLKKQINQQNSIREKIKNYSKNYVPDSKYIKKNYFVANDNYYQIDKRNPLAIKPNYLSSCFGNNDNNRYFNPNSGNLMTDLNSLKYKADKMEKLANNAMELERINHRSIDDCDTKGKIADYLLKSINAKLEIFRQLNK